MNICPCGSEKNYADCCGIYIDGQQSPATPEALMRSRYTAYTQTNIDYIAKTMQGPALEGFNPTTARLWAKQVQWLKLKVIATSTEGDKGFVEFQAHYSMNGKNHILHELSEFDRVNNHWFYVDGEAPKIGRNDPCPCKNGKKYKKCCGS